ncbi:hypothetical protein QJQ45_007935 [Haematococcus lacustris]|nr:hypothetical protein QJQ45_007935 [Haematococcus lacustris]
MLEGPAAVVACCLPIARVTSGVLQRPTSSLLLLQQLEQLALSPCSPPGSGRPWCDLYHGSWGVQDAEPRTSPNPAPSRHSPPALPPADPAPSLTPPPQPTLVPQLPWPQHWEGNITLTQVSAPNLLLLLLLLLLKAHIRGRSSGRTEVEPWAGSGALGTGAGWFLAQWRCSRPLLLEEPASLALFCTGLAPDLGPAPEVMPACCTAFTGWHSRPSAAPGQDLQACCHATGPALDPPAAPAAATTTTLPGLPAVMENTCTVSFLGLASGMGLLPDQATSEEAEEQACLQAQASQRWPGLLALLEVTHCLTLDPVAAVRQEAGWQLGCMLHSASCMAHPHQHLSPCPAPSRARCPADGCGGQCLLLDVQQASWAHAARQELTEDQPELLAAAHGIAGQGPGGKDPNGLCEQLLVMALGPLPPLPPPERSPGSQTPSRDEAVLPAQSAGLKHTALNSHALTTLLAMCQGYATSACLVLSGRCEGYRVQVLGTAPGQAAAAHPSRRSCHQAGARGLQQWQAVSPQCEGAAQVAAAGCELQQHLAQGDMALAQASAARAARALARAVTPAL